ncbi:hypothetical protein ACFQ1S_00540 [Kibdelosporangium lantanae]|uniref:Uncharacterized protein n=1 Tax=Kibdelosporangium lantanae TaxID=1497396 RepID=A0ABW3M1M9_9PSEU
MYKAPSTKYPVRSGTNIINVDGTVQLVDSVAVEAGGPAQTLLAALDPAGRHTGIPLRAGSMASDNRCYAAAAGFPEIGIGIGIRGYQTPAETPPSRSRNTHRRYSSGRGDCARTEYSSIATRLHRIRRAALWRFVDDWISLPAAAVPGR